jgi:hypothetical protein
LRFSRLFKPLYSRNKWKRKKKKKDESEGDNKAAGGSKRLSVEDDNSALDEVERFGSSKLPPSIHFDGDDEDEEFEPVKLGRSPRPDEVAEDDFVSFIASFLLV